MSTLAESVADLERWLPAAELLLAEPDTDGQGGRGQPGSSPPWNSAVAAALLDAVEGVARLRVALVLEVTGRAAPHPAASVTGRSITAIAALCEALPEAAGKGVARELAGYVSAILMLAAVDERERWQRISAECPYCRFPDSLRVAVRSGRVTCIRYGACTDSAGNHPVARMEVGRIGPVVSWADGLIT